MAGESTKVEASLPHNPALRPGDVLIHSWNGTPHALDFTIISPSLKLKQKPTKNAEQARSASRSDQAAATKHAKYDTSCARDGWTFQPIVGDTFGAFRADARKFFGQLLKKLQAKQGFEDPSRIASAMWQTLSAAAMFRASRQLARVTELQCNPTPQLTSPFIVDSLSPAQTPASAAEALSNMGTLPLQPPSSTHGLPNATADNANEDETMLSKSSTASTASAHGPQSVDVDMNLTSRGQYPAGAR
jgi:hypothetical protein